MKLPKFDDKIFKKCSCCESELSRNGYVSIKCLHQLCESCFKNKLPLIDSIYECKSCKNENNSNTLTIKDFKPNYNNDKILKEFYNKDKSDREKIIYKTRDDFNSEEEYNDFLEYVEKCLKRQNLDDIKKRYSQSATEKEKNEKEIRDKLEAINEKIIQNDPTNFNNLKFRISLEEGNQNQVQIIKGPNDPIIIMHETINYIPDVEKEKICGGYNLNQINALLSFYSKGGFRKAKI